MCLVFKTTCIDRGKPLREGAFFFTRRTLVAPLLITAKQVAGREEGVREEEGQHHYEAPQIGALVGAGLRSLV